jgi:hypothetical protein
MCKCEFNVPIFLYKINKLSLIKLLIIYQVSNKQWAI